MADPGLLLGLQLSGGILQNIPSGSSLEEIVTVLNQVIDKLNTWNGVIVAEDVTSISSPGNGRTTFTVPHNLNYAPVPFAFLNDANISGGSGASPLTDVNIPLASWLSIDGGVLVPGAVSFPVWVNYYTDKTNLYFDVFNESGAAVPAVSVTYYLMRLNANQK